MVNSRTSLVGAALLCLTGCATGPGVKWFAPSTWWSARPANAVDQANARETEAERAAVKLAQKKSHETQIALAAAPASRPVALATDANDTAVSLLDQASPFPATELAGIRRTYAGLLSDDPKARATAERARADSSDAVAEVSVRLEKTRAATEAAEKSLRAAFDRENALANELRSARALHWILGGVALLAAAAWVYVRFFLGGIPGALGSVMAKLEAKNPSAAEEFRILLDAATNRHEQTTIRNEYIKAK